MGKRLATGSGERARQRAIREVDLEGARPVFERISRSAQRISKAPIAHVAIAGPSSLWMAGVSDGPMPAVTREHSFAGYVVASEAPVWVENLANDSRFDDNPFVHGPEFAFRCYVGAPIIVSDGSCVGALSLIDHKPRRYDAHLAAALEDLAALVAQEWDRRKAMKALEASEARARAATDVLQRVIESAPVALMMTDRKLRVMQVSQKWRGDMGAGDYDPRGQGLYDFFPEARERWGGLLARALNGEAIHARKIQFHLPNGAEPWVRAEITPWRRPSGRIGGLLIMTHDITDMVEALEKTRRSEQTLKLALEIGELSMWEMDHQDRQVNSAGRVMATGAGPRDYEDMHANIWYGVHPADLPAARAAWDQYEADGTPFRVTFRVMQREGPHIWMQSATEVIRGEDGRAERTVGVMRNVDKQKRSEIALAKARDAAEAANRAKSEFLANMSHEIRTPLNGVMGVASALARSPLSPNQQEMVGLIESSAKTLEALLSDVLDLARVESGRLELASEPFELARCLADVAALFHPVAEAKGLDLILEPSSEVEGMFIGDAARVRQILSNLVANAVKFTAAGEVRLSASALRTPQGIDARISVKDTGIGFDEETKARLFGRFEQADGSITRRYGGSGLGLAISRSLTELMGGELDATAAPGAGAVFTFVLPLTRAAGAPIEHPLDHAHDDDAAGRALPRVLLAEDHPTNRRVVQLILEAVGVDLTCVENGALAVEAWESGDFDLVLMDMQMPVMDGLTAMREIRAREAAQGRPPIRIYALTANAMPDHARASHDAGADGHLTKPITAEALIRAVEAAADGARPAAGTVVAA